MTSRPVARLLWLASLAAAGVLFVYLVRQTGVDLLLEQIDRFGWGFIVLLVLSGARNLVRTEAWRRSIEPTEKHPGFWQLFAIRLVSAALTDLTMAGPVFGEGARVYMTARYLPASSSLSSIVLEDLSYMLASGLFILSGIVIWLLVLAPSKALPGFETIALVVLVVFVLLPLILIRRRWMLTSRLIRRLKKKARWSFLERYEHTARAFEESLHGFYENRRRAFLGVLGLEMVSQFTGVGEAFWILHVTLGHGSLLAAYLVECMYRIVTQAFIFIPLRMGVDAGSTALVLKAVGSTAAEGVTLAIIRKIRTLFWVALGLILLPHYSLPRKKEEILHAQPAEPGEK
ncbi:MAG: lysylphosphatidylglycerol synthase domain-containing protein [Acidobacteriota bacterium]